MIAITEQALYYLNVFLSYFYKAYEPVAIAVMLYAYFFKKKSLDVKFPSVATFMAFLFFVFCVKLCVWNGRPVPVLRYSSMPFSFLFVFLEDAFYAMLPFYICEKIKSKSIKFGIWAFFSAIFGYAHIYQGIDAVFITAIYPFFISRHFALKTSWGTVMMCHFLYDCFVYILPRLNNILIYG